MVGAAFGLASSSESPSLKGLHSTVRNGSRCRISCGSMMPIPITSAYTEFDVPPNLSVCVEGRDDRIFKRLPTPSTRNLRSSIAASSMTTWP